MSPFITCTYCSLITTILCTLLPMTDKFIKAVTKQFHTLFLRPAPESAFHPFIGVTQMSTKVFAHFWKKVQIAWRQVWTAWRVS